jgi:O-antigen ligase
VASVIGVALLASVGVRGLTERAASVSQVNRLERSGSITDRVSESRHAMASIRRHPLLGIGPAGDYGAVLRDRETGKTRPRRFVHNQYMALAVSYGIPALVLFVAVTLAALAAGLRAVRRIDDELSQLMAAAALGTVVAVLLSAFLHVTFLLPETCLAFFFVLGVLLGTTARASEEREASHA